MRSPQPLEMTIVGVDTGGTFTDFVTLRQDRLSVHKVLSTPDAPERAILQGIEEIGLAGGEDLFIIHGSTIATNAALEGKGVRTVYIGNRGLGDLLTIGRQARGSLYELQPVPVPPPVPRELCLETGGRIGADGSVVETLTAGELAQLKAAVAALAPRSVAINLLFSFLDDRFEREIEACLDGDLFVARSSSVLPEYREFERGIATWLNAWLGPIVEDYLRRVVDGLGGSRVSVMQSSGGTISAARAGRQAARMLLSGPAGGLAGARCIGQAAGHSRLLSFDMGGTSTDVALIDGEPLLTSEGHIGPWPVAVPMVDMHTIGAGGGSIARIDAGGMLQVGPESAGARPGPACYGQGGGEATVTDANLMLGRLLPGTFLGGRMQLDAAAADAALSSLAGPLGMTATEAARGIVRIANEHMARALRVISVERGVDPRGCTLISFGGAGGLHVCALADAMGMTRALVPVHAGVLSALGMLAAPRAREMSHSVTRLLDELSTDDLEARLEELIAEGRTELIEENLAPEQIVAKPSIDLRYLGQSHALNLGWDRDKEALEAEFHRSHERHYGHRLAAPVEVVNLRVGLRGPRPEVPLELLPVRRAAEPVDHLPAGDGASRVPVYARTQLAVDQEIHGPALITEQVSTTFIAAEWRCAPDRFGNLQLSSGR